MATVWISFLLTAAVLAIGAWAAEWVPVAKSGKAGRQRSA